MQHCMARVNMHLALLTLLTQKACSHALPPIVEVSCELDSAAELSDRYSSSDLDATCSEIAKRKQQATRCAHIQHKPCAAYVAMHAVQQDSIDNV